MSQENVETVKGLYALLDTGDAKLWDAVPPDFLVDFSRRLINPLILPRDEARAILEREAEETWDQPPRWEPREVIDAGDKVLAFIRTSGRGKASGAEVEARVWNLWTFRDGRPVAWEYFGDDRAAARHAAGLPE
jgi:ketosteroid isomerase-like protein